LPARRQALSINWPDNINQQATLVDFVPLTVARLPRARPMQILQILRPLLWANENNYFPFFFNDTTQTHKPAATLEFGSPKCSKRNFPGGGDGDHCPSLEMVSFSRLQRRAKRHLNSNGGQSREA